MAIDLPNRIGNGLLLITLQSAEDVIPTVNFATDVVGYEEDSLDFNGPFKSEASNESTGSFAASAPIVMGQPATFSFRSRIKGAGAGVTYTGSVRPPLHQPFSACGWLGAFTPAVTSAALTAGTTSSATLGTGFGTTAQMYRGMPLVMSVAPAVGRLPLITDYTAGKVATLTDLYGSALSASNSAALPANWLYAPTTPTDTSTRASMQPAAMISYYEDGTLWRWLNCRGTVDLDGGAAKAGFAAFNMGGIFLDKTDVAMPTNGVYPGHGAPILVQGSGTAPAFQINRRGLAISTWSIKNGLQVESPEDPNSNFGFGAGLIAERDYYLEIDPLTTLVATRNAMAEIASLSQHVAGIQLGMTSGNRASIMLPLVQPVETTPGKRGQNRSETLKYKAVNPGRDNAARDGDVSICFS